MDIIRIFCTLATPADALFDSFRRRDDFQAEDDQLDAEHAYALARRWLEGALAIFFADAGLRLLLSR